MLVYVQSLLFYKFIVFLNVVIPHDGCGDLAYTKLCLGWVLFVPSLSQSFTLFLPPFHSMLKDNLHVILKCRKGDYYRYLAEFKTGNERKEAADQSLKAYEVFSQYDFQVVSGGLPLGIEACNMWGGWRSFCQ